MKKLVLFISVIIFHLSTFSQNAKIDSLENVLANHPQTDTVKINLLTELAFKLNNIDAEKSLRYALLADSLSDVLHFKKGKADSHNVIGIYYYYKSDYKLALKHYHIGLKISGEIKDSKKASSFINNIGIIYMFQGKYDTALLYYNKKLKTDIATKDTMEMCKTYNNFGIVYHYKGDYPRAMEYYQKTLALSLKIKDKNLIAGAYSNMGIIYNNLGEHANALEYYQKSYQLKLELGDKFAISRTALSIGVVHSKMNNLSKALEYYEESLKSSIAVDYKFNTSIAYGNIGGIYLEQDNYPKALEYIKKGLELAEEVGSKRNILGSNIDLCKLFYKQKKYSLAIAHGEKAYKMAVEIGGKEKIKDASDILAKVYAAMGNYEKAYKYHVEFKNNSDSIYNESNIKEITNIENKYAFEPDPERSFNRQSSDYFADGRKQSLINTASPKAMGKEIGRVDRIGSDFIVMKGKTDLSNGDGLCFIQNNELIGLRVEKVEDRKVYINDLSNLKTGTVLFRNYDHKFSKLLEADKSVRKVSAALRIFEQTDRVIFQLTDQDQLTSQFALSPLPELANNFALANKNLSAQLSKSGDSMFTIESVSNECAEAYFFRMSELNEIRRTLFNQHEQLRIKAFASKDKIRNEQTAVFPKTVVDFSENISNSLSAEFHREHGVESQEASLETGQSKPDQLLMTTRYCIKYELGYCARFQSAKSTPPEPLFLQDKNRKYLLQFDCKNCLMHIRLHQED